MAHRTADELEHGLEAVRSAPADEGFVRLIVRRPGKRLREILDEGELDLELGLVGDDWINRPGMGRDDPTPHAQVTVMNARFAELIAGDSGPDSWVEAGDQLYLDLDISEANLPAGACLELGSATIEIQPQPHTGCVAFSERFGSAALRLTATQEGRSLRLRGANAMVVRSGTVRQGDVVRRVR
jgi:MOSC domain-containing protein YiiM